MSKTFVMVGACFMALGLACGGGTGDPNNPSASSVDAVKDGGAGGMTTGNTTNGNATVKPETPPSPSGPGVGNSGK